LLLFRIQNIKDDEDGEIEGFGFVESIEFLAKFFVLVLWVCKKFFSQTHYILAFRTVAFLMGLMMIGITSYSGIIVKL